MQEVRVRTVCLPRSPESGPHSVPAVRSSLMWDTVCRLFALHLSRVVFGAVLALSIHCGSAWAGAAGTAPVAVSNPYAAFISEASQRFGLPASWLRAVMRVESACNPKAVSPKGAMGLMQLMPDTWSALRIQYHLGSDPLDPHDNILGGAAYLRELFDRFGASGFLAAYNAGPKRFQDYMAGLRPFRDETKRYLATLAQMLPDLQIGVRQPAERVPTDWRVSGLFIESPTSHSPSNNTPNAPASQSATASQTFALRPRSDGLFVPVRLPDQR